MPKRWRFILSDVIPLLEQTKRKRKSRTPRAAPVHFNPVYIGLSSEKQHITARTSGAMELHGKEELKGPVLHIVVVGFHHKKGCQVEYSYPPLIPDEGHDSNNLPEEWKYLPFLALPDGAHNYQEDTVFFHLPPLTGVDMKCVYGVSCYRQIEAKSLKVRLADVTRETVQKSVCVLSRVPLYGLLQAKLQLITHAYFEEKDFSQISILKHGLADSSYYRPKSSVSEDISLVDCVSRAEEFVSVTDITNATMELVGDEGRGEDQITSTTMKASQRTSPSPETSTPARENTHLKPPSRTSPDSSESDWETLDPSVLEEGTIDSETGGLGFGGSGGLEHPETFDPVTGTPITVQPRGLSAGPGGQGVVTQGLVSGLEEDQVTCACPTWPCSSTTCCQTSRCAALSPGQPTSSSENREDVFLDGTGWEGGDEWIRAQFGLYIHSLLSSTLQEDNEKLLADWGAPFISAWRITHNYRVWFINNHPAMADITPGHPFQGQYSAADLKLRFSHSVQNSERGKKMGAAVITTSRSVVQTGKAVVSHVLLVLYVGTASYRTHARASVTYRDQALTTCLPTCPPHPICLFSQKLSYNCCRQTGGREKYTSVIPQTDMSMLRASCTLDLSVFSVWRKTFVCFIPDQCFALTVYQQGVYCIY
ncbi:unnamed protein product [Coregonus sp. 'balchen']|nr:unnamed protein product [Coregonus sp. 'balchen']